MNMVNTSTIATPAADLQQHSIHIGQSSHDPLTHASASDVNTNPVTLEFFIRNTTFFDVQCDIYGMIADVIRTIWYNQPNPTNPLKKAVK